MATVYGAALAATSNEAAAADVTVRVAAQVDGLERPAAAAVRLAMEGEPHPAFAVLPPAEREALALARVAGLGVTEIAEVCGVPAAEVKARLSSALQLLRGAPAIAA